jgi:hypothetical protein
VLKLPSIGACGLDLVSQPFAEDLIKKLGVDGRFFVVGAMQVSFGFQIGPTDSDFMSAILGGALQQQGLGRVGQKPWDEEGALPAHAPNQLPFLLFKKPWPIVSADFPSRHACSVLVE